MKNLSGAIRRNIKNNPVLFAAALLAVFSMCFIRPDEAYLTYIDFKVILLLFCLMLVVAGWQKEGLFDMRQTFIRAHKNIKSLWRGSVRAVLFSSMSLQTTRDDYICAFYDCRLSKQDSKSLIP
jgi:Na+/H+ antiporter NhaD/arsenite permease-like protein